MQKLTPKEEKALRIAYMQTFGTTQGLLVLQDLQARCFKYQSTFVPGDANATHINEGARRILLTIEEMVSNEGIQKLADAQ